MGDDDGRPAQSAQGMLLGMEDFRGALMTDNWKLIVYSRLPVRYELTMSRTTLRKKTIMPIANPSACRRCLVRFNEYAWEMAPSLYLEDLHKPRKYPTPIYWGDNPVRPFQ